MTSASRHTSHYINLAIDMVMLGLVTSFLWHEARSKRSGKFASGSDSTRSLHSLIYGPFYLVLLGSMLILMDPMRHVLQDLHFIGASMYIHGCPVRALQIPEQSCTVPQDCGSHDCGGGYFSTHPGEDCFTCWSDGMCSEGAETFQCLSAVGWTVTVVCTYLGFALFFAGVLWNSNLPSKIVTQWKILRSTGGERSTTNGSN